jgi:lipoprotein-anchoring transpeptidase ErfK/SrfK
LTVLSTILARGVLAASVVLISTETQALQSTSHPARNTASRSAEQQQKSVPPREANRGSAVTAKSKSDDHTADERMALASDAPTAPAEKCHWWQFRRCDDTTEVTEGLPPEAPRTGTVITVDVSANKAYLFQDGKLIDRSPAATGTEKLLKRGHKLWAFHTPRGHLKVLRKIEDPVWTKPDWAFVEAGEPIPPPDSPKRLVKNHLGKYALDLGDGIMIHGTDDIDSLGRRASHGCVRLPEDMLETVYKSAKVGTDVYIFESQAPKQATATTPGQPERHSDLD